MEGIVIHRLCKSFEGKRVLEDFSASFPAGETSCIMAPSGHGKTTLLRILMGLERADSGTVSGLEGMRLSAVFQEDRLCDRLTPVSNIRLTAPSLSEAEVLDAMAAVGLTDCASQPAIELSGGMRRRTALLRALMAPHDVLFLDEPFKGLDAETKALVTNYTRRRCEGKTVLLVTHEPDEASAMGAAHTVIMGT